MNAITIPAIERMIYVIRGQKVMLDSDLAELYEVETKYLNRQLSRNMERFPDDFAFQLTEEEFRTVKDLQSKNKEYGGRRTLPYVFTESGVAMLSSVLGSGRAIQVNISIMRTFIKMRSYLALESGLADRVGKIEHATNSLFKNVFERLEFLEADNLPKYEHPPERKRIGLKPKVTK